MSNIPTNLLNNFLGLKQIAFIGDSTALWEQERPKKNLLRSEKNRLVEIPRWTSQLTPSRRDQRFQETILPANMTRRCWEVQQDQESSETLPRIPRSRHRNCTNSSYKHRTVASRLENLCESRLLKRDQKSWSMQTSYQQHFSEFRECLCLLGNTFLVRQDRDPEGRSQARHSKAAGLYWLRYSLCLKQAAPEIENLYKEKVYKEKNFKTTKPRMKSEKSTKREMIDFTATSIESSKKDGVCEKNVGSSLLLRILVADVRKKDITFLCDAKNCGRIRWEEANLTRKILDERRLPSLQQWKKSLPITLAQRSRFNQVKEEERYFRSSGSSPTHGRWRSWVEDLDLLIWHHCSFRGSPGIWFSPARTSSYGLDEGGP